MCRAHGESRKNAIMQLRRYCKHAENLTLRSKITLTLIQHCKSYKLITQRNVEFVFDLTHLWGVVQCMQMILIFR